VRTMKKLTAPKTGKPTNITGKSGTVTIYKTGAAFTLAWRAAGERKREKRKDWESAQARANEILSDLGSGTAHVRSFTAQESAVVDSCVQLLQSIKIPLGQAVREYVEAVTMLQGVTSVTDAVRGYLKTMESADIKPIKFADLGAEFMLSVGKRGLSERYRDDCRNRLAKLEKTIGTFQVTDLSANLLEKAIETATTGGNVSFNNYRSTLNAVLSFAQRRNYLPLDRRHQAELVEKREIHTAASIAIYTPQELRSILANIDERLLPFVCLGAFAGIRSAEIARMTWEQVDLRKGYILLDKGFTKTKRRRIIPICDALRGWIETIENRKGRIYEFTATGLDQLIRANWPQGIAKRKNGFRHSYGTYRFAQLQDEQKTSAEMGNSPKLLREHYAELATPEDAKAWFSIAPKRAKNITRLEAAA
jgi:integrase